MSIWLRALAAAALGAIAAALGLTAVATPRAGLAFEMNGPPPAMSRGFYGSEQSAEDTLAWTAAEAALVAPDFSRTVPWSCIVRFRSGRPAEHPRAVLLVTVDGGPVATAAAPDQFENLDFSIPEASQPGVEITLTSTPPFTPGTADTRELGVQVDRLACTPARGWVPAPSGALRHSALAGAAFGFVLVATGGSIGAALITAVLAGLGCGLLLSTGGSMYGVDAGIVSRTAFGVAGAAGILLMGLQIARRRLLSGLARFAIAVAAIALFLKIVALLHPAKPLIDAMFHAHRLEWVMAGRWLFTQPFVGGVEMPYAVGLYVFALPWTFASADHVALIRIVTATVDVLACLLLYPLIVRVWDDRRTAAAAVLATQLAPLPYAILGNANLTNLFGQSMALVTMVAAVALPVEARRTGAWLVFVAALTWALCSHVSTATTLACTLAALAVLCLLSRDADMRRRAVDVVSGLVVAAAASWAVYYRHFHGEFGAAFSRMFSSPESGAAVAAGAPVAEGYMTTSERVGNMLEQALDSAGLPLILLAAMGLIAIIRRRQRDPLTLALVAWAAVWLVFCASTVFARVDAEYVRYAAEFLGRINLATIPLLAIVAARGASWGWTPGAPAPAVLKVISIALLTWAGAMGFEHLLGWFSR